MSMQRWWAHLVLDRDDAVVAAVRERIDRTAEEIVIHVQAQLAALHHEAHLVTLAGCMSRTHPRGCLTSSQRPPSAAVHRQCRAALGGGGAEDWVGGRCRHRSTAGGGAYARRMAGGDHARASRA